MKLREIAERIRRHLQRFESDKRGVNRPLKTGLRPFFLANAFVSGRYVGVTYVSYQGASYLEKSKALAYLEALDAGRATKHYALEK